MGALSWVAGACWCIVWEACPSGREVPPGADTTRTHRASCLGSLPQSQAQLDPRKVGVWTDTPQTPVRSQRHSHHDPGATAASPCMSCLLLCDKLSS